jgi:hypothetical protein
VAYREFLPNHVIGEHTVAVIGQDRLVVDTVKCMDGAPPSHHPSSSSEAPDAPKQTPHNRRSSAARPPGHLLTEDVVCAKPSGVPSSVARRFDMLQNTFCHIPGFGPETERRLWSSGLHSWDEVRDGGCLPLAGTKSELLRRHIRASAEQLSAGNVQHFAGCVPAQEHWRLFREFGDSAAYLDIETTGLSGSRDHITTIVMYDGSPDPALCARRQPRGFQARDP